jgi:hypothetical protein
MIGKAVDQAIKILLIVACVVGFALAGLVFVVAPWAWGYIKPIIHSLTA